MSTVRYKTGLPLQARWKFFSSLVEQGCLRTVQLTRVSLIYGLRYIVLYITLQRSRYRSVQKSRATRGLRTRAFLDDMARYKKTSRQHRQDIRQAQQAGVRNRSNQSAFSAHALCAARETSSLYLRSRGARRHTGNRAIRLALERYLQSTVLGTSEYRAE
jgi:hypothetical protein